MQVQQTRAIANYPHSVEEAPGLIVLSGQGHRIAGSDPAVFRGLSGIERNVTEASLGVLDNIQRALQPHTLDLDKLNSLVVYVIDADMLPEVKAVLQKHVGQADISYKVVTGLPLLHFVEMEGTACSDATALETAYPSAEFSSQLPKISAAVHEVFAHCHSHLLSMGISLKNLSHVTLTLQDQKTQYASMDEIWNALFTDSTAAPTRTCVFNSAQQATVHIAIRTSPKEICRVTTV